ncbi:MAG: hypothetical protein V3U79_03165 [Dehalococcoidia bacterium]
MSVKLAADSKVCRSCSVLALSSQDLCPGCGAQTWGPVPRQLAYAVHPDQIKNARVPVKLAGYRGFDWPLEEFEFAPEELPTLPRRDPDFAAMLASMCAIVGIWGVGHIYVGKVITGIILMLTGAVTWSFFVLLIFIGKGPIFWFLGLIAWGILIFVCYPDDRKDPARGRGFLIPGLAISSTVFTLWSQVEVTYIFMALGLTVWVFLTTQAYNLAVEFNESRDRKGTSLW